MFLDFHLVDFLFPLPFQIENYDPFVFSFCFKKMESYDFVVGISPAD